MEFHEIYLYELQMYINVNKFIKIYVNMYEYRSQSSTRGLKY